MDDQEYFKGSVGQLIKRRAYQKARRYISDPSDAPDDIEVEEGPQGGYYYETGGTGEADIRDEPEDIDEVEVNGVSVSEGTEFEWEDGSTVTVEGLYEDEDGEVQVYVSDEATEATSVDIDDIEEQMEAGNLTPIGQDERGEEGGNDRDYVEDTVASAIVSGRLEDEISRDEQGELASHLAENLPDELPEGEGMSMVYDEMNEWMEETGVGEAMDYRDAEQLAEDIAEEWDTQDSSESGNVGDEDEDDNGETEGPSGLGSEFVESDNVTLDTERVGEVSGTLREYNPEYNEVILETYDGEELYIPTDDVIDSYESDKDSMRNDVNELDEGEPVTIDTENAGELSGTVVNSPGDGAALRIMDDSGTEMGIPTEDIHSLDREVPPVGEEGESGEM